MKRVTCVALAWLLTTWSLSAEILPAARGEGLDVTALQALDPDPAKANEARRVLRDLGPAGLRALLDTHAALIAAAEQKSPEDLQSDDKHRRLSAAVDTVAGQRDALASRLYWHTDLERARAAAKAEGKPILSLRLLGKLTDEFSCANSRFFRTTLYANARVSAVLRDQFILHWESVRPVPRVTIDFGDGRKLECTLTGNSIHYVLDADGKPIDALPGLYGPAAFLRGIDAGRQIVTFLAKAPAEDRGRILKAYHQFRWEQVSLQWQSDMERIKREARPATNSRPATVATTSAPNQAAQSAPRTARAKGAPPTAAEAAPRALGKGLVELPILTAMSRPTVEIIKEIDDGAWKKIAALHAEDARLDGGSVALIRKENPRARQAGRLAETKARVEDPILRLVANFETSLALDTVRNEYMFHRQIHEWFLAAEPASVAALNDRVYAELFLTPKSDPWLGLSPDGVYTALENAGVRTN